MLRKVVEASTIFVKSRWNARRDYKLTKLINEISLISSVGSIAIPPLTFLTPVLSSIGLVKWFNFFLEYFANPKKRTYYELELRPLFRPKHFVQVGYEIADDEIDDHKNILKLKPSYLAIKEKLARTKERFRIVGLDKDVLTRHFVILGTTGAGKTSFLMNLFEKIMKVGGGIIFVDGKADDEMFKKLYSLAVKYGRENDVFLINFLMGKGDLKNQTNTFNPLLTLPPVQIVSFLASLMGDATGDSAYWQGRGKALLRPIVFFYDFRKKFWGELFSFENIQSGLEAKDTTLLAILTYTFCLDLEDKLKQDENIQRLYKEGTKIATPTSEFPYMQVLRSLFITAPYKVEEFKALGYDEDYLTSLYSIFNIFKGYITQIKQTWWEAVKFVAEEFYKEIKHTGLNIQELGLGEIRLKLLDFIKQLKQEIYKENEGENKENIAEIKEKIQIVEDPNILGDALEQHGYASQQWTEIFSQIETFSHIFGSTNPDVNLVDILKNNKILYVLLPALEQDKSTVNLLGKMVVVAMRQAFATTLGGRVEISKEEKDIYKSRVKPKPIGLAVLDEYGAYPVSGIDTILAQVRSLNISFMLSVQDYQSLRAEDKEGESKRAWANTSKVIFQIKDAETIQKLRDYIKKKYIAKYETEAISTTEIKELARMQIEAIDEFDPTELVDIEKGFGVMLIDKPVFFQSFWADAPFPKKLELLRFENVE